MSTPADDAWGFDFDAKPEKPPREPITIGGRAKRVILWMALLTTPLSVMTTAAVLSRSGQATATASTSNMVTSSPGRLAATRAVQAWLTQESPPLLGGKIASWDGAVRTPAPLDAQGKPSVGWDSSVESFTVTDSLGNAYTVSVQVAIDPRGGASAISSPSLIPQTPIANDSWDSGSPWPGLTSAGASDAVKQAIQGWVTAFTSGDPAALRIAVGDTNPDHDYVPLTGATATNVQVTQAASFVGDPSRLLTRVTMVLTWPNESVPDSRTVPVTYDVLLTRADTAAPIVVAWGAPGSGSTMRAYSNAVAAVTRTAPSTAPPSTSSSKG